MTKHDLKASQNKKTLAQLLQVGDKSNYHLQMELRLPAEELTNFSGL
jgi:hypothetical protein